MYKLEVCTFDGLDKSVEGQSDVVFQIKSQALHEIWQGQTHEQVNITGYWSPVHLIFNFHISYGCYILLLPFDCAFK